MLAPPPLPRKYDACVRDMSSAKAEVRASAAQDIVRYGRDDDHRKETLTLLKKGLDDESPRVRAAVAIALADLEATDAVPALIVRMEDDDAHVRQMAITALGEINDPRSQERLLRALADRRPEVRYQAVIAYARVATDEDDIAKAIGKATRDDDMNVRYIALRLAEEHGVKSTDVILRAARLLEDDSRDVAIAAGIYLTKAGDPRGHALVLAVVSGAQRAEKEDEREAVELTGRAGLRQAIGDLERRAFGLKSKIADTCSFHAIIALARMGHEKAIASIEADLASKNAKKRAAAVVAAGRAVLKRAESQIVALKGEVDDTLRDEALAALRA